MGRLIKFPRGKKLMAKKIELGLVEAPKVEAKVEPPANYIPDPHAEKLVAMALGMFTKREMDELKAELDAIVPTEEPS